MPTTQTQLRRGSTAAHAAFTGAEGELTIDTDLDRSVIHDGATPGGFPSATLHLAQTFSQSQTFAAPENFFGSTSNPNNRIAFLNPAGAGTSTFDFNTNGTVDLNFLRKYATTPFQIEIASSGGIDLVIDSNNNETGATFRVLTNAIRGGVQTALATFFDNGSVDFTGPLDMGTNLINNVVNPVAAQDAATKSYVDGLISAGAPPFTDSTALVKGSGDPTKLMRFEVDGFTAGVTRVLTPPNANIILAGTDFANAWADGVTQTFNPNGTSSGINVGSHAVDPSALNNGDIWYQSTANELRARINGATVTLGAGGATPPFTDTTALVAGSGDPTKLMRFEVDGFTTGTTRVLTPPNADITIAGINIAQTFSATQTFSPAVNTQAIIVSGFSLTGANTQSLMDLSGEWNTSGVTSAFKIDIDTTGGFGGGSKILDLYADGIPLFSVDPDGDVEALGNANITGSITGGSVISLGALSAGGSITFPYRAISGTDTFSATDYTIDTTSGTFTLNLPTAVGITGRIYNAKNSGTGVVTLDANGGELIDGVTTQTINPGASLTVQSTGAGWIIL